MADRVRIQKQESPGTGGTQTDMFGPVPIDPNEDGPDARAYHIQNDSSADSTVVISRDASNNMTFADGVVSGTKTLTDLLAAGSGITEVQHEDLDTLVHNLAETSYEEVTRSAGVVTNVTTWTTSGNTTKVREVAITRTAGQVSQIVITQYDGEGVAVSNQTMTGTVDKSSGQVTSIDWVQS